MTRPHVVATAAAREDKTNEEFEEVNEKEKAREAQDVTGIHSFFL